MRRTLFLLAFLALAPLSHGRELPWKTPTYTLRAQDTPTAQLIRDFCTIQGMRVSVDSKVEGEVSGVFDQVPPDVFLDQICKANGLTWFFDGQMLFIYREEDIRSEMLPMSGSGAARVNYMLDHMGVKHQRAEIKPIPEQGMTFVSGPPRLFEMVRSFVVQEEQRREDTEVQVFPLKYAWAYDLDFNFRDDEVTVPGVATVLQNISATGEFSQLSMSTPGAIRSSTQPKLKGQGLIKQSNSPKRTTTAKNVEPPPLPGTEVTTTAAGARVGPQIYADVRLNAVVIRDTRANLDGFAKIIRALDAPTSIVEINAAIIDVSTDKAMTLGTDFLITKKVPGGEVSVGFDGGRDASNGSTTGSTSGNGLNLFGPGGVAGNVNSLFPGVGGSASAAIIESGWGFLARIRAMEDSGNAKILARPSVLTLDNVEATLRNDETIYVRVAGQEEVDLFNVTAGVTLQVTPHVIEGDGPRRIKLVLNVEDGNFTQQSVDQVPTVQKSNINTQATILESQSLLIGGYTTERLTKSKRQVPLLGNIPLVGYLFKRDTTEKKKMERMFLITPRVVNLNYNEKGDVTSLFQDPFGEDFAAAAARPPVVRAEAVVPPPAPSKKVNMRSQVKDAGLRE